MDWTQLSAGSTLVLLTVLFAEAANGWTDAPCSTSAAVATGLLTSKRALMVTAIGNLVGLLAALLVGAAVAKTIGTGIVRADLISISSIGVAMMSTVAWAATAAWIGLPVSKTHSLLAALAGIGYAQGGFDALLPVNGHWRDSGWVMVGAGMVLAVLCGSALSWFLCRVVITAGLDTKISDHWWKRCQQLTVCAISSGHGFNDGLKYVGVFSLVLYKSGVTTEFRVLPMVIVLCATVMAAGTMAGGWRIHRRLDRMVNHQAGGVETPRKTFKPYMGVCAELTSAFFIWQTGWIGIPTSTTHGVTSAMTGAKSALGRVHISSLIIILWGWVVTYGFCFGVAYYMATLFL